MKTIALLLFLALLGLPVQAADTKKVEEPPAPEPTDLIETMTVSVVNVEAYVTDKKGNRIKGLKRDDFEILENGRPVAITNFSVMEGGKLIRPPGSEEEAPAETAPAVPGQPPPPPPVPEDQRLHLVVYIDNYNIQPFNRNRVLRELRDFLRNRLDEQDRVMLVTYDRELHVQRGWTTDPRAVAAQLVELETMTGSAVHRESDRRDALQRIEESLSVEDAVSIVRTYAGSIYNDLNFSIDALRDVVNGLAGMPGRKAVLYVSEGIPQIAGQDLFYAIQEKYREQTSITSSFEFDSSRRFSELTAAANANRVTFYTIDAGGLRTYGYGDASKQTAGQIGFLEQAYVTNLQAPLLQIAEGTGGKAIINANRVTKDLDKIAEDFDTFYSLGYTPGHFGDGRYYKIEVKLKGRKELVVRHREGYRDKPAVQRMNDGTMAALTHRFESNPLGLRLDFDPGQPNKDNLFVVPVKVSIPLSKVVMVPGDPSHRIRLKVYVVAMDNEGGMSEIQEVPVLIDIPAAEAERAKTQWYLYSVQLLMRAGPHRVAVGLRDEVSGDSSFITGQVLVGRR